jgi:hypothetical protein
MNDHVTHPGHAPPRDFGVTVPEFFREAFGRFADDLNLSHNRRVAHPIFQESVFGNTPQTLSNTPRRL